RPRGRPHGLAAPDRLSERVFPGRRAGQSGGGADRGASRPLHHRALRRRGCGARRLPGYRPHARRRRVDGRPDRPAGRRPAPGTRPLARPPLPVVAGRPLYAGADPELAGVRAGGRHARALPADLALGLYAAGPRGASLRARRARGSARAEPAPADAGRVLRPGRGLRVARGTRRARRGQGADADHGGGLRHPDAAVAREGDPRAHRRLSPAHLAGHGPRPVLGDPRRVQPAEPRLPGGSLRWSPWQSSAAVSWVGRTWPTTRPWEIASASNGWRRVPRRRRSESPIPWARSSPRISTPPSRIQMSTQSTSAFQLSCTERSRSELSVQESTSSWRSRSR